MEGIGWESLKQHKSDLTCRARKKSSVSVLIPAVYISLCSAFKVRQIAFIISLCINLSGHKS